MGRGINPDPGSNSKCPNSIGLKYPGFLNTNYRYYSKARSFLPKYF